MLDSVILLYTTMVKKTYTASDIEILKGIEPVQKRPGMYTCLLYTSPSPRDKCRSRMPSSA